MFYFFPLLNDSRSASKNERIPSRAEKEYEEHFFLPKAFIESIQQDPSSPLADYLRQKTGMKMALTHSGWNYIRFCKSLHVR